MKKSCYTPQNHAIVLKVVDSLEKIAPDRGSAQPPEESIRGLKKISKRVARVVGFDNQKKLLQDYIQQEIDYMHYFMDNNNELNVLTARQAAMQANDSGFTPQEQEMVYEETDNQVAACHAAWAAATKLHDSALELIYEIEVRFTRQPALF